MGVIRCGHCFGTNFLIKVTFRRPSKLGVGPEKTYCGLRYNFFAFTNCFSDSVSL